MAMVYSEPSTLPELIKIFEQTNHRMQTALRLIWPAHERKKTATEKEMEKLVQQAHEHNHAHDKQKHEAITKLLTEINNKKTTATRKKLHHALASNRGIK